ncbi:MAG TPA: HAD family hydrolase [Actinomycetota bacterium]|nr:HAD family hydrolase [Actinomycetota bacterium]
MKAVLFDVDGTLVDTAYLHALAWWRTCRDEGRPVPMSAVHRLIGMGADKLLESLFGSEVPGLEDAYDRHFGPLKSEITAFPKAAELLRTVASRGSSVVLATSARDKDIEDLRRAIGADDAIAGVTTSSDVESSKPAPDVFATALETCGVDASEAIAVGDTGWDIESAGRCGLSCVAVLTGGWTRDELERRGAVGVYEDVADLLDKIDSSPLTGPVTGGRPG